PPDTAPDRSLGGGALLLRPPEQPALVPARPRAPAPALLRPPAAPPEPPASTASATSTTSRPAPSRGSRDSGCFMPDRRRRHTRFGKRTASETPERDELTAALLQLRSLVALVAGDPETSVKYADACLAGGRWCSSLLTQPQCVAQLGFAAVLQGRRPQSADLLGQALRMSEERGDTWHRCYLLWALAVDHGEAGEPETALRFLRRALRHIREIDECMGEAALGETLAWVLSSQGDARLAAMVLGAVDGAWHPSGAPRLFGFASLTAHRERCIRNAHEALGRAEYARAYRE